ncbi:AraC family ligand binding domain-containing protein, partial [Planctomycetota bacterium]|nr:AraC family ligand binding domain-containing protein [Planctomycetota bacterium]
DFLKIVLVHDGMGTLRCGPDATECRRGDALVIPAGRSHEICDSDSEPLSLYVVSIRSRVLELACFDPTVLSSGVVHLDPHTAEKVERSMRRLLFEQTLDTPTTGAQMIALALRLIADLASQEVPVTSRKSCVKRRRERPRVEAAASRLVASKKFSERSST